MKLPKTAHPSEELMEATIEEIAPRILDSAVGSHQRKHRKRQPTVNRLSRIYQKE